LAGRAFLAALIWLGLSSGTLYCHVYGYGMFINSWPQYIKMSFDNASQYHNLVVSFDIAMKTSDGFHG